MGTAARASPRLLPDYFPGQGLMPARRARSLPMAGSKWEPYHQVAGSFAEALFFEAVLAIARSRWG